MVGAAGVSGETPRCLCDVTASPRADLDTRRCSRLFTRIETARKPLFRLSRGLEISWRGTSAGIPRRWVANERKSPAG